MADIGLYSQSVVQSVAQSVLIHNLLNFAHYGQSPHRPSVILVLLGGGTVGLIQICNLLQAYNCLF